MVDFFGTRVRGSRNEGPGSGLTRSTVRHVTAAAPPGRTSPGGQSRVSTHPARRKAATAATIARSEHPAMRARRE